jgi:hypothetical protein
MTAATGFSGMLLSPLDSGYGVIQDSNDKSQCFISIEHNPKCSIDYLAVIDETVNK